MAAVPSQTYPAPFDAVAERYDETFTFSRIGQIQRNAVLRQAEICFPAGHRILEIGCGTGIDACFLAKRGIRVVACDSSSQMVARAERRVQENRVQKLVLPVALRAEQINALQTSELFDGAFSNFGALNCIEDSRKFAVDLARLLKPGATALLCWIGPCCLWEMVWYLSHGKAQKAFRRFKRNGVTASLNGGPCFSVRYPTIRQLADAFGNHFRLRKVRGIGVAVPPSYMEPWGIRHPRLLRITEKADLFFSALPGYRMLADHVLLDFERKDTQLRSV